MPDEPARPSPCDCHPAEYPFECPRHQCVKTAHWHLLCRERPGYFELWEQGRGPGQPVPSASGNVAAAANA